MLCKTFFKTFLRPIYLCLPSLPCQPYQHALVLAPGAKPKTAASASTSKAKTLMVRNEDHDAKLRRSNLRISGVKEGRETGKIPVMFMADLLKDALGLDSPPTLDSAYRTLRARQGDDGPPRAYLIKCHLLPGKGGDPTQGSQD